jgi:Uma2 family endonuclease
MSHATRRMTAAEFLDWQEHQTDLHELVDGRPVAMAGAKQRHDRIVANALGELHGQLRGGTCRTFTADLAVVTPRGNVRRPDLGIHCGPFDDEATQAGHPRLVVEVLSRSTRTLDQVGKLEEYKSLESLDAIVLIDPEAPEIIVWSRDPARAWQFDTLHGLDAKIAVPSLGVSLTRISHTVT